MDPTSQLLAASWHRLRPAPCIFTVSDVFNSFEYCEPLHRRRPFGTKSLQRSQMSDCVLQLRRCTNFLVQLTEAEHNLFTWLFQCDPTEMFCGSRDAMSHSEDGNDVENAFE